MKKLSLFILVFYHVNLSFAQEVEAKQPNTSYHRFGMNVLTAGYGLGFVVSPFPLSFYVANDLNQIISFGFDAGFSMFGGFQGGFHMGFGRLYKSKSGNPNLHIGYLIEFSAGFSAYAPFLPMMYLGFHPNFILEIDQFVFKTGVYVDTSLTVSVTAGIGFLLK